MKTRRNPWEDVAAYPHIGRAAEVALVKGLRMLLVGPNARTAPVVAHLRQMGVDAHSLPPCPDGNYGDPVLPCKDSPSEVAKYQRRIAAFPADIKVEVPRLDTQQIIQFLRGEARYEPEQAVLARVARARELAFENGTRLTATAEPLLRAAIQQLHLDLSQVRSVIRTAVAVMRLAGKDSIGPVELAEAIQYAPRQSP